MSTDVSTLLHRLGGVYRDPSRVSRDSSKLLRSPVGTNLVPSISPLIQNTGEETPPVLVFSGTVSMSYKGGTYNIPVDVYLPPPYPVRPPVCFVRPTVGMMIKENHRHVAPDGMVFMPYLHEWRPHSHNLVEMVVMMSSLFGSSPPCFAKPAGHTSSSAAATVAPSYGTGNYSHNPHHNSSSSHSASDAGAGPPSYDAARQEATALAQSRAEEAARLERERKAQEELQRAIDESMNEEERKRREAERERLETENARRRLTARLQSGLQGLYHETRAEIQEDLRDQSKLERGSRGLDLTLEGLKSQREELEKGMEGIDDATVRIQSFLSATEGKRVEPSPDELANPADVHSAQMLKLAAENQSYTDALYFLDRALVRGRVDMKGHMKAVRRLAKKQFLVRAHLMKIAQVRANQNKGMC
uniref:UEV domain-containing protein n=1 Tax=Odontella aurita TaxID=265563 RepID=A0A6U6EWT0_9STRA|mmetsp:Transcript_30244/g.90039  ORF Transcript_30244/g.90039 Transcript_30244/m.90039 type:complete len:417 (+) Transcript_30244:292-1542(+)|eukprot:CAMPEP_0113544658 /NCGR_PEP_ID=MMETSP0015_2-20120614/10829_1 /TAXON_ID=2838 /ORGANISM="Odontella" /LENGTH=416 /DNA_ID=CAMNT_0000444939 /DNA_START=268 /DNA_END=1518 /DNA_ORIENTATION=+ /assembly_acc=CAM_ASM_000160